MKMDLRRNLRNRKRFVTLKNPPSPLPPVKALVLLPGLALLLTAATLRAQDDPGAKQDAESEREKILKAADQLDMIQTNAEAAQSTLVGMKADLAKLQDENIQLRQQLADLQAAFDKAQASRDQERQALLDKVSDLVAAGKASSPAKTAKKKTADAEASNDASPAPRHAADPPSTVTAQTPPTPDDAPPAPVKKVEKGYYHVVEDGETLSMICEAYRDQGIHVTVSQIRKANGLTEKSILKVGQKLFIPKREA